MKNQLYPIPYICNNSLV